MLKYLIVPFLVSCIVGVFSTLIMMYFHVPLHGVVSAILNAINMFMTVIAARECSDKNFEKAGGFLYLVVYMSVLAYYKNKYPQLGIPGWMIFTSFFGGCLALGNDKTNEEEQSDAL